MKLLKALFLVFIFSITMPSLVLATYNPTRSHQTLDSGNTMTVTSAEAQPANPWIGDWSLTRSVGVVRILVVLAATDTSVDGLGGTFTFEFSENGISHNGISEERTITDFQTVRDFDLINAGAYFRVKYEPDRALSSDSVFITTNYDDKMMAHLCVLQINKSKKIMPQCLKDLHI